MQHDDDRKASPDDEHLTAGERLVDTLELVAATAACALVVSLPVIMGGLVQVYFGPAAGMGVCGALGVVVVVLPAALPGRSDLDGYQRWGTRVGRALREPLRWREARRQRRRALGASSSSSSAAAPSLLPPHR